MLLKVYYLLSIDDKSGDNFEYSASTNPAWEQYTTRLHNSSTCMATRRQMNSLTNDWEVEVIRQIAELNITFRPTVKKCNIALRTFGFLMHMSIRHSLHIVFVAEIYVTRRTAWQTGGINYVNCN